MALTVAIESNRSGGGLITNAESTTGWTTVGTAGSPVLEDNVVLQGSYAVSCKISNKNGWVNYDIGSGNELDFTPSTGNVAGECIYIWFNLTTLGLIDTAANEGLSVRIGSSTANYDYWLLAGSDIGAANGYSGGWMCVVIDPTVTPTGAGGTGLDISSARYFGIYVDITSLSKSENIIIDTIAVGKGLRLTGTDTDGWQDAADYCNDYANRAWGMMQEEQGIYYIYGTLFVGDSGQTAITSLTDSGRVLKFGDFEYYTGSAWASSISDGFNGISVEDAASYATTLTDGVIVGSDSGRSGSTFIGSFNTNTTFDLYGGNNAASLTRIYGAAINGIDGSINFGNDSDHHLYSTSFNQCGQVDPVGGILIRNCLFIDTVSTEAALLWNSNINIEDCSFIANTTGAAYEYPDQGTYGQTSLTFSGNTYDILYSDAASSGVLTINATDSNPSTYEITNPTGNSVSIVNSVNLEINGVKTGSEPTYYVRCRIQLVSDGTELMNKEAQTSYGSSGFYKAVESYNYVGDVDVIVRARFAGYLPFQTTGTITSSGLTVTAVWIPDPNYT